MRKIILEALTNLKSQKIILYPTDTVWGIGCDATNENTVSKVFDIKNREESKSLVVLVDSLEMLKAYV
ncbi:MAG: Sua5/YciO/YrdC/YwlC family protein, partial [Aureibaculum sp.]